MKNHTIIDTTNIKKGKFTFANLTTKQKNLLQGGGLSFAGIVAAVGLHRLFSPPTTNTEPTDINNTDNLEVEPEILTEEAIEVTSTEAFESVKETDTYEHIDEAGDYTFSINTDATFASGVEGNMTFEEAFATAREEIGAGGFFNWNGNSYSTFTETEWNSATEEQQKDFFSNVNSKLDAESYELSSTSENSNVVQVETQEAFENQVENSREVLSDVEAIEVITPSITSKYRDNGLESSTTQEQIVEVDAINTEVATSAVVTDQAQTIVVVPPTTYGTGDMNEDGIVDALAVDTNGDGHADLVAMDENFDGTFESFMINEDGDEDLDIFIIDQGGDGIDDTDTIEEVGDIVDMHDFVIVDEDDSALEDLDFIDDLIDVDDSNEIADDAGDSSAMDDVAF